MSYRQNMTFGKYRKQMMKAAIELGYGLDVVNRVENASSDSEITDIMNRARRGCMEEDKWKALDRKVRA